VLTKGAAVGHFLDIRNPAAEGKVMAAERFLM